MTCHFSKLSLKDHIVWLTGSQIWLSFKLICVLKISIHPSIHPSIHHWSWGPNPSYPRNLWDWEWRGWVGWGQGLIFHSGEAIMDPGLRITLGSLLEMVCIWRATWGFGINQGVFFSFQLFCRQDTAVPSLLLQIMSSIGMKHTHGPPKHNVDQARCPHLERKLEDRLTGFHWNESVRFHAKVTVNDPPKESYREDSWSANKHWI